MEKNENQLIQPEIKETTELTTESTSPKSLTKIPFESNEIVNSKMPSTAALQVDSISKDHSAGLSDFHTLYLFF